MLSSVLTEGKTVALEDRVAKRSDVLRDLRSDAIRSMSETQLAAIKSLSEFRAPYVREKLQIEGKVSSDREFMDAFTEFKKYVALAVLYPSTRMEMPSRIVDDVWHQFILFTKQYMDFCDDHIGRYLHHSPKTSFTPGESGDKGNFIGAYRKTFGDIPEIWQINHQNSSCWSSDDCVTCCRT